MKTASRAGLRTTLTRHLPTTVGARVPEHVYHQLMAIRAGLE